MHMKKTAGNVRCNITPGLVVDVVQKQDQRTGRLTRGTIASILTNSATHPHGIKVRLRDGTVGRVAAIIDQEPDTGQP